MGKPSRTVGFGFCLSSHKIDMTTPWQKDVEARKRIRPAVEYLVRRATELDEPTRSDLHQALVRVKACRLDLAQSASFDLSYAEHHCRGPDLRKRIEEARRDLDALVF